MSPLLAPQEKVLFATPGKIPYFRPREKSFRRPRKHSHDFENVLVMRIFVLIRNLSVVYHY